MTQEKWTPTTVKARLEEIISIIKNKQPLEISETEIRELQHFFNEKSQPFLKEAWRGVKRMEYIKSHPEIMRRRIKIR